MPPDIHHFEFVREVNFAPAIVFDALVDPVLLGGWLADAHVEHEVGGAFDLVWLTSSSFPPTHGSITVLDTPVALEISTDNRGSLRFDLEEYMSIAGRSGTRLKTMVSVAVDGAFLPKVSADWQVSLDQLDELLHGRPVNWGNWDRERSAAWREYFAVAGGY